jgi:hypothetical protein
MLFKFNLDNIAIQQSVESDQPVLEPIFEIRGPKDAKIPINVMV